jgi:signal transduction histidine kinase
MSRSRKCPPAVELMKESADPKRKAGLERDVAELDALIDENLLALATEECARYDDTQLDGEPVTVRGDSRLLRRMIRNLLENAKRHGAPPIRVRLSGAGDSAELAVYDHGPGVPEAERERVFDPFYRHTGTKETTGAGLGLALVRQIARRHGGQVRYAPQSGAGQLLHRRPAGPSLSRFT